MSTGNSQMIPATVDEALHQTVSDMLNGSYIDTEKDKSYEVLHYQTGMSNPCARIANAPQRRLNIVGAVARFVWMVAGSNRLEDIAFYEEKVRSYTDNRLTVPGSSYGKRLFDAAPGLDQIRGVIERLRTSPDTRQAAAVVWSPEDAVRVSSDIPCTFGMFFHVRDGGLIMSTVMRSNNAFRLMHFNFFEFSLLGEVVAATVGIPMTQYVHWAASMHVYDTPFEMPTTRALAAAGPGESIVMPEMPREDAAALAAADKLTDQDPTERAARQAARELATPIGQATELARLEAQMRHTSTEAEFDALRGMAAAVLNKYWLALFNVLASWVAAKRGLLDKADAIVADLPEYLRGVTRSKIEASFPRPAAPEIEPLDQDDQGTLFNLGIGEDIADLSRPSSKVAAFGHDSAYEDAVQAIARFSERQGDDLPISRLPAAVRELMRSEVALAARDGDVREYSDDDIRAALDAVR